MTLVVLFFSRFVREHDNAFVHALIAFASAEMNAEVEFQSMLKGTMSFGLSFRAIFKDILRAGKFIAERSYFEVQKMYVTTFLCVRRTLQETELKCVSQPVKRERRVVSIFEL